MKWLVLWIPLSLAAANPSLPGHSIYHLTSQWTDQEGKIVSLDSLKGRTVVAAMAYTSCPSSCPLIVEQMKKIEALALEKKLNTSFVLFSFDSEHDTPKRLKQFALKHQLDLARWTLLRGTKDGIRELSAVFGVRYQSVPGGDFNHSNLITLVDPSGVVRYQQNGLGQDPKTLGDKLAEVTPASSKN